MTLSFHIRHEVTSERSREVFSAIRLNAPLDHITQADRQQTRLRQIGLLDDNDLTTDGRTVDHLCERTPALWGDLLHYLHYSLWKADEPLEYGFSWTYRSFSDYLWRAGITCLDADLWEPVVGLLIGKIESIPCFSRSIANTTREGTVSLSKYSLIGATHWFRALTPPVIEREVFTRRAFCPPELALLALGWVGRTQGGEVGIDWLLTPERREAVCKVCLLEPTALDRVLDWTLPLFPDVIRPGTGAGVYGRFLRFLKWPELSDLLR